MICYLTILTFVHILVSFPDHIYSESLSINTVWERDLGKACIVDIIALHSIAINNSWYTLVLLARRTCTTLNFNCRIGL